MFTLKLKKDTNSEETFYRYEMDGNILWFTQSESGNIYNVSFAENERLSGLELYINIKEDFIYYPDYVYIITGSERLFDSNEIDKYIDKLQYAKKICKLIMEIFESEEHKRKIYTIK